MNDNLRFHPQVPHDLAEAIAWYEEISVELANRLRAAIRNTFENVRKQPLTHGIIFDDVRFVRAERFPYLVQFRIHSGVPHILGVFHSASDPAKWNKRAR